MALVAKQASSTNCRNLRCSPRARDARPTPRAARPSRSGARARPQPTASENATVRASGCGTVHAAATQYASEMQEEVKSEASEAADEDDVGVGLDDLDDEDEDLLDEDEE